MFFQSLDVDAITAWAVEHHNAQGALLMFVAAQEQDHIPTLLQALKQQGIECFGGIFMRLIAGQDTFDHGCVVTRLKVWRSPFMIHNLHQTDFSLETLPRREELPEHRTLAVFADADAPYLAQFLTRLYSRFGNRVQYFGGGVGILGTPTSQQKRCVFSTEQGMVENAAIIALIDHPSAIAANHGWQRLHGPLLATRSEGNILHELNWQPAFDVYRQVLETQIERPLRPEELGSRVSHGFPLGMFKQNSEDIVRLPSAVTDDGGMVCIGGIQMNSVVHILHGEPKSVIKAVDQTLQSCNSQITSPPTCNVVVDCVTRYWFLEELGSEELVAIQRSLAHFGPAPVIGALFKGEIASDGLSSLELLNKSVAIGSFM